MNGNAATPAVARVIRAALFAGVALFGVAAWYITRNRPLPGLPEQMARYLAFAFMGLAAASLAALSVVRSLRERSDDVGRRSTLTVVGWALGEAPALFGGVLYLLTANAVPYLTGLAVLLVAFLMISVPEEGH